MVWTCSKIRPFWLEVTAFISSNFDLPNLCNPKWCLLGIFEDIEHSAGAKTFLRLLLYYARKTVVLRWIKVDSLHLGLWKRLINQNLPP